MIHNIWLLQHWPKKDHPNQDPIIYKLAEEFEEEQAKQDLKKAQKDGYVACLLEIDGFDTPQEVIETIENIDEIDKLPPKPRHTDYAAKLTYQGKDYYFPKWIITRIPETNLFNSIFDLSK